MTDAVLTVNEQRDTRVWVVVGLIHSQSVHLSEIANHIPGETDAAGRIMGICRWLASRWIVSRDLYTPIITEVLEPWAGREVTIMLDGCFIRHKALQMLRVSRSHCYRALPLAWEVVTPKATWNWTSAIRCSMM